MSVAQRVLVTGANGFIGQALLPLLIEEGFDVVAGTRNGAAVNGSTGGLALGDMADANWSAPELDGINSVVHLAAIAHRTGVDAQAYEQVNAQAPIRLAEAAAVANCDRFIFLSTAKVLGDVSPPGGAFTDQSAPNPPDDYAKAKLAAETQIEAVARNTDMTAISLRPPLVHGPKPSGNLAKLIAVINQGGVSPLRLPLPLGNTANHRSLIGRESLCRAIVMALKHPAPTAGRYLFADQPAISTSDLLKALAAGLGKSAPLINFSPRLLDTILRLLGRGGMSDRLLGNFVVESDGFQQHYGWEPDADTIAALKSMAAEQAQHLQNQGADR
ncbi:MAG: NAD-dependent epimerase/dehydratase family protein [Alphaproteobacteria bacterium]|nr:NAD-dependent epimerase/dehydratase family protein [Alphaproteobacteria bacterium SS10]